MANRGGGDEVIREGAQLFKEGRFDEAIVKLKAAVDADPSNVQARSYLGAAYAASGQHPASVEQFQAAVDLSPQSAVHTFNLGQAFEMSGNRVRAQAMYEKALSLDPGYARARQQLNGLTGGRSGSNSANQAAPTPLAPQAPAPAQTAAIPTVGAPAAPPAPAGPAPYGGPSSATPTQYGPQPSGFGPSLGLGRKEPAYGNYSAWWKRLVAFLIDMFLMGIISLVIVFAMKPSITVAGGGATLQQQSEVVAQAMTSVILWMRNIWLATAIMSFCYIVGFNTAFGATPGKLALGMRILKIDGSKIGFGTALGRYLIQFLLSIISGGGLAHISIVINSERRGLHDQAMGTMVVDK